MCELARNLRSTLLIAATAAPLMLVPATASANTIAWQLNITQVAGFPCSSCTTSLSGSYTYDADANAFSSVDVTFTATGPGIASAPHFTTVLFPDARLINFVTGSGPDFTGATFLDVTLASKMTDAGGTIFFVPGLNFLGTCADAACIMGAGAPIDLIIVGSVNTPAAVPEASTWAMLLLGFAGLGFAFRRSRHKVVLIGLPRSSLNRLAPASLAAALLLSVSAPSSANTITTFDISGTATNEFMSALGSCGAGSTCAFSGTINVDVTAGTVTALDLTFPGLPAFDTASIFSNGSSVGFGWVIHANNGQMVCNSFSAQRRHRDRWWASRAVATILEPHLCLLMARTLFFTIFPAARAARLRLRLQPCRSPPPGR